MYRSELNGYFPRDLIQQEYRKHLSLAMTSAGVAYVSNQSVEDLLNNRDLMKHIALEIEDKAFARTTDVNDVEIESRVHHKPSKDIDYD